MGFTTDSAYGGKRYRMFLCHHKAAAGAFARLLKYALIESPQVTGDIFLDSDDLFNLDTLFDCVASETETLVVLGTRQIFQRPWCVGEMTKARVTPVPIKVVALPDYELPDESFIKSFASCVNIECLVENGMDLSMVHDTLRWVAGMPLIPFDRDNPSIVGDLVRSLVSKTDAVQGSRMIVRTSKRGTSPLVGILVDMSNSETFASAHVLLKLLEPMLAEWPHWYPSIISDATDVHGGLCFLLVLCTNGCFKSKSFLILLGISQDAKMLPVVCEETFRFPTKGVLDELRSDSAQLPGTSQDPDLLPGVVGNLFKEIAVTFAPQMASDSALRLSAKQIAARLAKTMNVKAHPTMSYERKKALSDEAAPDMLLEGGAVAFRPPAGGASTAAAAAAVADPVDGLGNRDLASWEVVVPVQPLRSQPAIFFQARAEHFGTSASL
mmetsp:Transcript_161548/g.513407  ORF Transcript_161548/g.513407 Transcript_161548/m.513407 type:complete len:439 (-) Transcript_161548:36-1352(-)